MGLSQCGEITASLTRDPSDPSSAMTSTAQAMSGAAGLSSRLTVLTCSGRMHNLPVRPIARVTAKSVTRRAAAAHTVGPSMGAGRPTGHYQSCSRVGQRGRVIGSAGVAAEVSAAERQTWSAGRRGDVEGSLPSERCSTRSDSGHTCHLLDRHDIFMTASLDSAESQCIRSERHVTSCRGGQVELVVWLAQMVPAMPSILGDHSRIRTGRIWRWCRMAPPPRRVRANHCALRLCRSRLFALTFGG